MSRSETDSLEQEESKPETRPSRSLPIVLCVVGGLSLLSCVGITIRTVASGGFSWFEVLVSFGLPLIVGAMWVLPDKYWPKGLRRQSPSRGLGWGTVAMATCFSAITWWSVFWARPVSRTDFLITALWGPVALLEGLWRFRLRGREASAASRPDSMVS